MMTAAASPGNVPRQTLNYSGPIPDMHTVAIQSAGNITLPNINKPWYLRRVALTGGTGFGSFAYLFDGISKARFGVGNALHASWDVNYPIVGNVLPSGNMTFEGDANPTDVVLTFGSAPLPGAPSMDAYRAILIKATESGANSALQALTAVNYDIAPAVPRALIAAITAGYGQFYWPAVGGTQGGVDCTLDTASQVIDLDGAPALPSSNSLILSILNSAAAHLTGICYYAPTVARRVA